MDRARVDTSISRWSGLTSMARIVWDNVTLDELISCEGDTQKLIALVQQRYNITYEAAAWQVMNFFRTAEYYQA
jgi:hypothetical protein